MATRPRVDPLERPWPWIVAVLLLHGVAFLALPPDGWLVRDEVFYVQQAEAFARGRVTAELWDGARGEFVAQVPSRYPPGTSLLMALPVRAFGQRGVFVVPWLASIVLVLATGAWLQRAGHSPLFALLTLAYPPTLVLSRLAMSDVPSAAIVACALASFEVGAQRARIGAWLGAGLLCGASLCLRETNPWLLLPLFLGAALRRERHAWALLLGTAVGAGLRPLGSALVFGDPLFHKATAGFSVQAFFAHAPIYLFATLCFVPGGLYWVLRYRGPRRAEIVLTVAGFIALYAAYRYAGADSGFAKSLVLGPRYLIPLTPLLAFCAAASFSAWRARARQAGRPAGARLGIALVVATALLAVASAVGMRVHGQRIAAIRSAIAAQVRGEDLVVTNLLATDKLLFGIGHAKAVDLGRVRDLRAVLAHADRVWVVILDREDSARWRALRHWNEAALRMRSGRVRLQLALDRSYPDGQRLRIHRVRGE